MQSMTCGLKLLLCIVVIIALLPVISESGEKDGVTNYYRDCIIAEIDNCNAKADLCRTSKSFNLRKYGRLKEQKSIFLIDQKEMLIKRMMEARLEPKKHAVKVFLNTSFFKEYRK